MSRTESTMVQLGTIAPAFELTDVLTGRAMSRDDVFALSWDDNLSDAANTAVTGGPAQKHGLLVMFLCVHCPFVIHVEQELANIARDYAGKIAFCAIMSNDVAAYPQDSPDNMRAQAKRLGWNFPYLYDETQEVARSYNARLRSGGRFGSSLYLGTHRPGRCDNRWADVVCNFVGDAADAATARASRGRKGRAEDALPRLHHRGLASLSRSLDQ